MSNRTGLLPSPAGPDREDTSAGRSSTTQFALRSLVVLLGSVAIGLGIGRYVPSLGGLILILGTILFISSVRWQPGWLRHFFRSLVAALTIASAVLSAFCLSATVLRHERYSFPPSAQVYCAFAVFAVGIVLRLICRFSWPQLHFGIGLLVALTPGVAFFGVGDLRNYSWAVLTTSWLVFVYIVIPFAAAIAVSAIAEQFFWKDRRTT
jgi:hypothetical protein